MGSFIFFSLLACTLFSLNGGIVFYDLGFLKHDLRKSGSGNTGATNALRTSGWTAGAAVLLFDSLKTFGVLLIAQHYGCSENTLSWLWLASICLHCFSPFYHFQGGKGVAVFFGGLACLYPEFLLPTLGIWGLFYLCFSIAAFSSCMAATFFLGIGLGHSPSLQAMIPIVLIFLIILWRHQENVAQWSQALQNPKPAL